MSRGGAVPKTAPVGWVYCAAGGAASSSVAAGQPVCAILDYPFRIATHLTPDDAGSAAKLSDCYPWIHTPRPGHDDHLLIVTVVGMGPEGPRGTGQGQAK